MITVWPARTNEKVGVEFGGEKCVTKQGDARPGFPCTGRLASGTGWGTPPPAGRTRRRWGTCAGSGSQRTIIEEDSDSEEDGDEDRRRSRTDLPVFIPILF